MAITNKAKRIREAHDVALRHKIRILQAALDYIENEQRIKTIEAKARFMESCARINKVTVEEIKTELAIR